jgi:hypothetical protein
MEEKPMLVIQNRQLLDWIRSDYTVTQIDALQQFLRSQGTFEFRALPNGLFPAAVSDDYTGYDNVWVRDNVHVAHAHLFAGEAQVAVRNIESLTEFFQRNIRRLEAGVSGEADLNDVMNRPHIRFNGQHLEENSEQWAHAQNDAIGYYLWLLARLGQQGLIDPTPEKLAVAAGFVRYLATVQFWEDEDSGHWEETRKIAASSIGVATAGLRELQKWIDLSQCWDQLSFGDRAVPRTDLQTLIDRGQHTLDSILPCECRQEDPAKFRRFDAALLFLIFPVETVLPDQARTIADEVVANLAGPYGVRRYLGDSYWCADYKEKLAEDQRTADFSEDLSSRDALLEPGTEAQWCIFDPILSVIHGRAFEQSGDPQQKARQIDHLNRSLGQLTSDQGAFPAFRCPESYYLSRGEYVPNDITPLLWTQANLWMALEQMRRTAGQS